MGSGVREVKHRVFQARRGLIPRAEGGEGEVA